jgi:DNA repair protein SbcC/Rad50
MILLQELHLDGFLSYDKAQISLNDAGITYIKGETGSGKSSILEAVAYLLYGKTLRKKDTVSDLVNKVLDNGYDISLYYNVDGDVCTVREVRGRKQNDLWFTVNGEDHRGKTTTETRKNILEHLKLSFEEFKSIAFLGQRQSQLLVDGTNAERAGLLVDIFNLQKYDQYIQSCDTFIKDVTADKEKALETLGAIKEEITSLTKHLASAESVDVCEDVSFDEDIRRTEEHLEKLQAAEKDVIKKVADLQSKIDHNAKVDKVKKDIEALKIKVEKFKITEKLEDIDSQYNTLVKEAAQLDLTVKNLGAEVRKIESLSNICPVSNNECPVNIPVSLKDQRMSATCMSLNLNTEKKEQAEYLRDHTLQIKKQITEKNKLEKEIKDKESSCHFYTITEDVEKHKENAEKVKEKIESVKDKLKNLREEKSKIDKAIAAREQRIAMQEKLDLLLKEKQDDITKLEKSIEKCSIQQEYGLVAHTVFKELKFYKIDLVLELLNKNTNEVLQRIAGEYKVHYSSRKASANKKKTFDQLNLIVYNGSVELPVGMLSGGQTTLISLATMLGIIKTSFQMSNKKINNIFLDEPFNTLSSILNPVFEEIVSLSKELEVGVKIISHRELNNQCIDYYWEVEYNNGISTITKVGQ